MTVIDYASDSENSIWTLIAKETKQFLKFLWDKQSSFIEIVPFLLNSGRVEVNLRCRC